MKIYIGADHRGFELKEKVKNWLSEKNYLLEDLGAHEYDPQDDYPIYAERVADKVSIDSENEIESRGIVICGSGAGVDIVANKFKNVRSGLAMNHQQIKESREDDNINVLALSADYLNDEEVKRTVSVFLETEFSKAYRKIRRLSEIEKIENDN